MKYELIIPLKIKRKISRLDKSVKGEVIGKISVLKKNPYLGKHLTGCPYWSLRAGKYRIVYSVKNKRICVLSFAHRKKVYK